MTNDDVAAKRHALVGPPELWKLKRDFQITFLKERGLRPENYVVDIGCGTLRGGVPIIRYLDVGHYCGIEVRSAVLAEARKELAENNLESKNAVLVSVDSFAAIRLPQRFNIAWAFSVFFHMADRVLADCLGFVRKHLAADGRLFANVLIGHSPLSDWQGFPVVHRTEEAYARFASDCGLQIRRVGTLRELGHHSGIQQQDEQMMLEFS